MSPQLLWTIAGLILTVLTLGGVSISAFQSTDSATAKLVASEVGNISTATKLWAANNSNGANFTGVTDLAVRAYIPDLAMADPATDGIMSKAVDAARYKITADSTPTKVVITVSGLTGAQYTAVTAALSNKACVVGGTTPSVTYTCAG